MKTKRFFITNNSEGSICVTGRQRIDIPGKCRDLPLVLPEASARQTVSRLKQRYPLLKIREAVEATKPEIPVSQNPIIPEKEDVPSSPSSAGNGGKDAAAFGIGGEAEDKGEETGAEEDPVKAQTPAQKSTAKKKQG